MELAAAKGSQVHVASQRWEQVSGTPEGGHNLGSILSYYIGLIIHLVYEVRAPRVGVVRLESPLVIWGSISHHYTCLLLQLSQGCLQGCLTSTAVPLWKGPFVALSALYH